MYFFRSFTYLTDSKQNIYLYKFPQSNYNEIYFQSLKCRSGNQQIDVHFQKVLKTCRNRYTGSNTGNGEDSTSTEDKSSGSDSRSEEEVYDNNFFDKNDSGPSYNHSNDQRYR